VSSVFAAVAVLPLIFPGALRTKRFLASTVVVGADTVLRLVSLGVPLIKGFLTSEVRSEITSSVSIGSLSISGFRCTL
jgi:hypothetical protein